MPDSGLVYVVATPIGNLEDFSPRAVAILKSVDFILAEDTRHSLKLLQHCGVHTPLQSCHEHNEREKSLEVLKGLREGKTYALISDAGTPVFSDPGAKIIDAVLDAGFSVIPIPGACAAIAALSVSGFEGLPFHFYGFLPASSSAKRKILAEIKQAIAGTLAFYESPHRLIDTLQILQEIWSDDCTMVLAKELTKIYETIYKASIHEVIAWLNEDNKRVQGEFVLLIENKLPEQDAANLSLSLDDLLKVLMKHLKLKEAVQEAAQLSGLSKNLVYERALALKDNRV